MSTAMFRLVSATRRGPVFFRLSLMFLSILLAACSGEAERPSRDAGAGKRDSSQDDRDDEDNDDDTRDKAPVTACGRDNPFCAPAPSGAKPPAGCDSLAIEPKAAGVNIMLAVDASKSMDKHWPRIISAIRSLRAANPDAAFGVHRFWSDSAEVFSEELGSTRNTTNNACLKMHDERLELGDHSADELVDFISDGARGGVIAGVYQVAPIIEPLSSYLTDAHALSDSRRTNYLLVFSHGNDNCFGSAFTATSSKLLAYKKLAVELARKSIRVVPVGLDAPMTAPPMQDPLAGFFDQGFVGNNYEQTVSDYQVLETLLANGGSGLSKVPRIDTEEKVEELATTLGLTLRTCRFALPSKLDVKDTVNAFELSFAINAQTVPRDRLRQNGWDFVKGTEEVEFFGQGCAAIQAGQAVETRRNCGEEVCGTSALEVSTKPRAVLLLLDSSQSRTSCSDGSLGCNLGGFNDPNRPRQYWEVVQQAVSEVLVAPVNDEVMFGMQFFPFKNSAELSCEVATEPEIIPAPGQQIAIMKAMLEKVPNGLSPVAAVMDSVATNPGILSDPSTIGAVVLLTEGGDNCTGQPQEELVARLGNAAKRLLEQNVRTFAVRYGGEGQPPPELEQLAAVAANGGAAVPNQATPYLDAKTPQEFLDVLTGISEELATCSFELGELDSTADKQRANLFMDGKTVGFDSAGEKLGGWGWVDDTRTMIELYGDDCSNFKKQRHTNISVEFGCESVVLL